MTAVPAVCAAPEPGTRAPGAFWAGRAVLVTGAGGFVGAAVARALADRGARVTALVRRLRPGSSLVALGLAGRVRMVVGDVTEAALLERTIAADAVEVVFHIAAEALVGAAHCSPVATFRSNILGTWTLLEACRAAGVAGVVVASSDKVYGEHDQQPYDESLALQPRFPYETSKACADLIARSYAHSYALPVAVTRCANIYGPGDLNWDRIVPGAIRALLDGERPIVRSDGTLVRDYLFVDDAVEGFLAVGAAVVMRPETRGEAFNLSAETPISTLDLVRRILRLAGRDDVAPDVRGAGKPLHEISRQHVGAAKARQVLGWRATVGLDDGLARSLDWYRAEMGRQT